MDLVVPPCSSRQMQSGATRRMNFSPIASPILRQILQIDQAEATNSLLRQREGMVMRWIKNTGVGNIIPRIGYNFVAANRHYG